MYIIPRVQCPLRARAYQVIFSCPFSQECTYRRNNQVVWHVLHKRLHFKPNSLQLVQALTGNDQEHRLQFNFMQMEADGFVESIVFSDETTFHLSGKVNRYNMRIWGATNPYFIVEHVCFLPLLNCFVSRCILVKTGRKISLGRLWPLMGIEG